MDPNPRRMKEKIPLECCACYVLEGPNLNPSMPRLFTAKPSKPTTAQPKKPVDKLAAKEAKWGEHRDATMQKVLQMISQGWLGAYVDGSPSKYGDGCKRDMDFFMGKSWATVLRRTCRKRSARV